MHFCNSVFPDSLPSDVRPAMLSESKISKSHLEFMALIDGG